MLCEIEHRWNGSVLFSLECGSLKMCVEAAVATKVSLRGSDLRGADLSYADLRGANLRGADLSYADLSYADLRGANLCGSDLRGANLCGSDLSGANLCGSDLRGANLRDADLRAFRDDIWAVLSASPAEVPGLRDAIAGGKIDGSTYEGDCCCLVGTLANKRGCGYDAIPGLTPDSSRLAEVWFAGIKKGDTPETNPMSKQALEWVDEWLGNMRAAFAV